ncbi:tryptophan synthase subunit alpha [Neoasaia chiangmaiensis NBRC 101099]|uniref:Tryptophan synthase alpha chain n=1 Tax=Neoasaia chiangmaiensis TaxID=320497 RepID=A0A1U9KQJ2_9PROT|nr:tryptophan synthase subunit alpha [Neoasaia chiangmaiensis]AQS88000.1 tryptophan synthase subunit alpha [Neoasaia chiangmaiensis]GBR38886.1 tryptophan synthase subunit alpha [Neoasaia chiangmaiensis NBRC 101099]GEN15665.1 tryptophan synthase alpha chain [Neoasaia chiangmaiensis]
MSRIKTRFDALKAEGRGALIPYLQAFDPDLETSLELLKAMPAAGADLIEIGVPFSDPSADGLTIQAAALRGLKAGATLTRVLEMVKRFREGDDATPIVLMGYLNPIDSYGPARFCADAAAAGVDGLIVVDLPPEEADLLEDDARANGLDIVRLVAPNTSDARLRQILPEASGFIYYVSITGITGTRTATEDELAAAMPRIRAVSDLPVAVGFGIRTPSQAAVASRTGDAAVVASALITTLAATLDDGRATDQTVPRVLGQLRELAEAVRG